MSPPSWTTARLAACALLAMAATACGGTPTPPPQAPPPPPPPPAVQEPAPPPPPPPPANDTSILEDEAPRGQDAALLREAVEHTDARRFNEAISILEDLHRRHPNNGVVLHELGLAYRLSKQPERAVALLTPWVDKLGVLSLAGLASALDEAGKGAEAAALLRAAITRHPHSGLLHSELATTLSRGGDTKEALRFYLLGIEVEPSFGATYYNLARLLNQSRYRGLVLVYGEEFRLLEPSSQRSRDLARAMVQVCQDSVQLEKKGTKTSAHVTLAPELPAGAGGMPLANAFELAFGPGLVKAHKSGFDLGSLHKARRAFLDALKKPKQPFEWKTVPLFPWLQALDAAGHLEAYDYWLYGPANADEATRWMDAHKDATDAMARYVAAHPLFPSEKR